MCKFSELKAFTHSWKIQFFDFSRFSYQKWPKMGPKSEKFPSKKMFWSYEAETFELSPEMKVLLLDLLLKEYDEAFGPGREESGVIRIPQDFFTVSPFVLL